MITITFTSCKIDDDNYRNCKTCENDSLGALIISEFCDNEDGTVTVTMYGQTKIIELEDETTFMEYITAYEAAGGTCK